MDGVHIVAVSQPDLQKLLDISIATFREAFGAQNAAEYMDAYIADAMSETKIAGELTNINSKFMFAYFEGQLAGYLKVNFGDAQTERSGGASMEIERVYVYALFYGSGVGQALFDRAMELARQAAVEFVWLGVWEHNARALRFYRKNGFLEFGKHIFQLGSDAQTDLLMRRPV